MSTIDNATVLNHLCVCQLLYQTEELDELLDQRLCRLFECSTCELQYRTSDDRHTLFRRSTTSRDAPCFDGCVYAQFHAMSDLHRRVFDYVIGWLRGRQANENHAMDNHFDRMNAKVREALMTLWKKVT